VAATRRLAAIMFTDMVGFTASTQTNEASALRTLEEQERLVRPVLAEYHGREIKSTGDGFLVEFGSALKATECAVEIQRQVNERNIRSAGAPIELRIGVHLGDIERRKGDVFGDAVNVAARIGPCATPGGICISGSVFELVRNKISNRLEKLEPRALKNVKFPVDIYRLVLPWAVPESPSAVPPPTGLAVLPFANISPDPKDEYFADGLTEELISALSQVRGLRVIARTSVTPYKSTSKGVAQIGAELRVTSVLEGSVRKVGNRLRVTAQLIDVLSEGHVWSKTYDRELDDVFMVQSEVATQVAEAMKIELREGEATRLGARSEVAPDSYLAYLKGRTFLHTLHRESARAAKEQFERAISLDPQNAAAYSGLADAIRILGWEEGATVPRDEWEAAGRRAAARAIELDPGLAEAHASLAIILWDDRDYAGAERELKLAVSISPSYSMAHHWYGDILLDEGRGEEALREFRLAEGADPLWPLNLNYLAWTLIFLGRLDEALIAIRRLGEVAPDGSMGHGVLARYHLARGDTEACLKELQLWEEREEDPRLRLAIRAIFCAVSGETEKAKVLLRSEEQHPGKSPNSMVVVFAYCEVGDIDGCIRHLEKQMRYGTPPFQLTRMDPKTENLRRDPRFPNILKEMGLG
jgi:adenylate cyclase